MRAALASARRALGREQGFTLVETLVAAMLVAIGAVAILTGFDGAQRASYRAEQSQVATDRAQRELEAIKALPYDEIALMTGPGTSPSSSDPRSRVNGGSFVVDPEEGVSEALVINGTDVQGGGQVSNGAVAPGPAPFESGDVSGTVHRFVVWRDDPSCLELICPGDQDLKRIIVAVKLDESASGGSHSYAEVQTDVVDPNDSIISDIGLPNLGELVVAQQFWLSDERCTNTGEPAHKQTTPENEYVDHATHDTLGHNCRSTTSDRPDALVTNPPENPIDLLTTPAPDFATDVETGGADEGLQFQVPASTSCPFKPTGSNAHRQAHIWVTKKLPLDFVMTGGATLELWTKTTEGAIAPGELCVTLFTRTELPDLLGIPQPPLDVRMANLSNPTQFFFTKAQNPWPNEDWTPLRIPMRFTPMVALPNTRLGVQVALRGGGGSSDRVEINYDHVQLESRLEVETITPLLP